MSRWGVYVCVCVCMGLLLRVHKIEKITLGEEIKTVEHSRTNL